MAEVQEDLRTHPPQVVHLDEVALSNGIGNGHVEQGPGSGKTSGFIERIVDNVPKSFTVSLSLSSECKTGTSDSARHPLTGPKYHVCIFEHNTWCPPHRVHIPGEHEDHTASFSLTLNKPFVMFAQAGDKLNPLAALFYH